MFVFYDTETSGLDRNSQILQIALVFTDGDLNILSSKKLECRRSPWVIPAPGAMLITGFMPDDLKNGKRSNYDIMQETDAWARAQHWPVTFIGYNSIGYDEPVLSRNLSNTLLDAGLTTAENGHNGQSNGRADIELMVKAAAIYMPGALKLDTLNEQGYASLTLLNVAAQNGVVLPPEEAHDAMNDIRATLGVARVIRKVAPQVWAQMLRLATAQGVAAFMDENPVFTQAGLAYGKAKGGVYTAAAAGAGQSHVLFNLAFDPAPYKTMSVEKLAEVMRSKTGGWNRQPFSVIEKDAAPMLMPLEESDAVLPAHYDDALCAARARDVRQDAAFQAKLSAAAALAFPREDAPPPSGAVRAWIRDFHAAPSWQERAAMVREFYTRFDADDKAARHAVQMAGRLVYEHAPEELPQEKQDAMKRYIAARALNPDLAAPYMTIARARAELEEIEKKRAGGGEKWAHVTDGQIRSLKLYYTALEKDLAPFAPAPPPANDDAAAPQAKKGPDRKFGP